MNDSKRRESTNDESLLRELASLMDRHLDALRRGEKPPPETFNPLTDGVLDDLRVLEALHDAACAIHEDSQMDAEAEAEAVESESQILQEVALADTEDSPSYGILTELRVGDRIEKFEIREFLGRGGQATTYKAWDADTERMIVVKLYRGANSSAETHSVVQEAQKLAKVRSPYVIQCHHVGRKNGIPYLVLEYVAGEDLAQLHKREPLGILASLELIAKVADGLAAVHARGLLHRDIKPSNIMVGHDGVPKLLDFGLTKPLGDPDLGTVSGTFSYMAPEQARGDVDRVDSRTDIFSLGATLYFLLTGHAPYEGTREQVRRAAEVGDIVPPRQRNPQVPTDVDRLCMRCLAKAPENRFASAHDLAVFLRTRRWRRYGMFAAVAGPVLAAVLITAWFLFGPHPPQAGSSLGGTASPEVVPLVPLKIELVEFEQLVRNEHDQHERRGRVLADPYRLRFGDALQFRAKLSRPAYCFWIGFRPDGKVERCFPKDQDQPPPLTVQPIYPANVPRIDSANARTPAYTLTDGIGTQAFALVVSDTPLPAYAEWISQLPDCPWKATSVVDRVIRRHDGTWEETFDLEDTGGTRGAGTRIIVTASPLDELVNWIRGTNEQPLIVEAWSLPVRPR